MKFHRLIVVVVLLFNSHFWLQISFAAEYPNKFNVKSALSGRSNNRAVTGDVTNEIIVRRKAVEIEIISYKKPDAPFLIECFFLARSEASRDKWVYDAMITESYGNFDKFKMTSASLRGTETVTTKIKVPMVKITRSSNSYREEDAGTSTERLTKEIKGNKIVGWIVRCRSEGKIVAIEASSKHDETYAYNNTKRLDEILLDFYPKLKLQPSPLRVFTNNDGKKVTARIIGFKNDKVVIKRNDGRKFVVPPETFILSDQNYILNWKK